MENLSQDKTVACYLNSIQILKGKTKKVQIVLDFISVQEKKGTVFAYL